MRNILFVLFVCPILVAPIAAQIPLNTQIAILKAEDARRYDKVLEGLMRSPVIEIRTRAALAAGRIGDEKAIPALVALLDEDHSADAAAMAAFAIGEIESIAGADAIMKDLQDTSRNDAIIARDVEAAGKIVAAHPRDPKSADLGKAILDTLKNHSEHNIVILGLTAALRARAAGTDVVVAKFLDSPDATVRATAVNTLARIRARSADDTLGRLLTFDDDPIVRANAARALTGSEQAWLGPALSNSTKPAIEKDPRVRVAAIRALGGLKNPLYALGLLDRFEELLNQHKASKAAHPSEANELRELATSIGRLLLGRKDERALTLLKAFAAADKYQSPETEIAIARIDPDNYTAYTKNKGTDVKNDQRAVSASAQGISIIAGLEDNEKNRAMKKDYADELRKFLDIDPKTPSLIAPVALPDVLGAFADFKTADLGAVARRNLLRSDVFVRAAAAGILGDLARSDENVAALKSAFSSSFVTDKIYNDAILSIMNALHKVDKKESVGSLLTALSHPDYLVRARAYNLLDDADIRKDFPGVPTSIENANAKHKDQVLPYSPGSGTRLGQVLNTDADYRRALSRKNGSIKAVVTTDKGAFTIEFTPEQAPVTVDNFVKLANMRYFNGVMIHRVVPNFVVQDGDPRGDGNGGPGWSIRCEINMLPFDRGAVGMALSGKDTGGSQYFVDHSPQPHLDGGYTVFGHVNEDGMKVVDQLVRGDRIISVRIVGR